MPDFKLIGKNYQTPDLVAKVTGRAKYAEDFRAEGMLFCKQLLSPEPHARVRRIDARTALAMSGVAAILTADELPVVQPDPDPTGAEETEDGERALTSEPVFAGEPILAVAAVDETTAAEAIERINVDSNGCHSSSIRSTASVLAARTHGRRATCSPSAAGSSG